MGDIGSDPDLQPADHILDDWLMKHGVAVTFDDARKLLGDLRVAAGYEVISEIERCALVLATENDETGNYLVAAVLKKAADIVRTTVGIRRESDE